MKGTVKTPAPASPSTSAASTTGAPVGATQNRYGNAYVQDRVKEAQGGELMLRTMTETSALTPDTITRGLVGHAWSHLLRDDGTRTSWGFWPRDGFDPANPAKDVAGEVRSPDPHDRDQQAVRRYPVDEAQVEALETYADAHASAPYNLFAYNCTDFAVGMVTATGNAAPDSSTLGVDYPNALKEGIIEANAEDGLNEKGWPDE